MHFSFYLAEQLHKTIDEIGTMTMTEYIYWQMYFSLKAQRKELAAKEANRGNR